MRRASESVGQVPAATVLEQLPPMPGGASAEVRPTPITSATPLNEAATILADQLRLIPGVERYADVRLAELDQRGSRPVRTAWRLARERMAGQYGTLTVGELLARFGRRSGGPQN